MHFLAEPESSTKTTAEASGSPTYRRFSERQRYLCQIVEDVLRVVVERRALVDLSVDSNASIRVEGGDVSARDNRELAEAGAANSGTCQWAFGAWRDRSGGIYTFGLPLYGRTFA